MMRSGLSRSIFSTWRSMCRFVNSFCDFEGSDIAVASFDRVPVFWPLLEALQVVCGAVADLRAENVFELRGVGSEICPGLLDEADSLAFTVVGALTCCRD